MQPIKGSQELNPTVKKKKTHWRIILTEGQGSGGTSHQSLLFSQLQVCFVYRGSSLSGLKEVARGDREAETEYWKPANEA